MAMKKWIVLVVVVAVVSVLAGGAFAQQMGRGPGMGWARMGGMMGGSGCAGAGPGPAASQISEDEAKQAVQRYADEHLKGFTVDKVLPFTGMGGRTMYSVELMGPKDEVRTLHVNPWGNVMPFGGPWRRSS
jgi:hypothetical protein